MTVYPTASVCCRTLQGDKSNHQRRMLRTFRDLTVDCADSAKSGTNPIRWSAANNSHNGDLEMGAVYSITTAGPGSETIHQPKVNNNGNLVNNFKYKVRNSELHSGCAGPSTLSHVVAEVQPSHSNSRK
jgi:hypothetical protein